MSEPESGLKVEMNEKGWNKRPGRPMGRKNSVSPTRGATKSESMAAWERRNRLKVLSHYSQGAMACGCCGENIVAFLTVDHIEGGGRRHRARIGEGGRMLARWLVVNNFPPGYQVLCMNCNFAKRKGRCPHEAQRKQ